LMDEKDFAMALGGGLPSLNDEALNRLADLVASRLAGLKIGTFPSQGRDHRFESGMRYQTSSPASASEIVPIKSYSRLPKRKIRLSRMG
jgi:hypothetical protein